MSEATISSPIDIDEDRLAAFTVRMRNWFTVTQSDPWLHGTVEPEELPFEVPAWVKSIEFEFEPYPSLAIRLQGEEHAGVRVNSVVIVEVDDHEWANGFEAANTVDLKWATPHLVLPSAPDDADLKGLFEYAMGIVETIDELEEILP